MKMTERQRRAVETRGGSVLVSAAAGSGKTTVLARRIVELIKEGADIRRMLICTFTNASARDMRQRITAVIEEEAERSGSRRLAEQAEYCTVADICTMHSFAIKVCRENAIEMGLGAKVRVAAEQEAGALMARAMEKTLRELYEAEDTALLELRDRYFGVNDKPLVEDLFTLYDYAMSREEGLGWLAKEKKRPVLQLLFSHAAGCIAHALELVRYVLELAETYGMEKQAAKCTDDAEMLEKLLETARTGDAEELAKRLSAAKIQSVSREACDKKEIIKERMKEARAALKEAVSMDVADAERRIAREESYIGEMERRYLHVLTEFSARYEEEKRKKQVIDLNDAFLLGCRILEDEGRRRHMAERFDYVFVDEYQDTNPVQESFLSRICDNRFMVGDIKQSIYRFRLADPDIFAKKADAFGGGADGNVMIHMNENFRSAPAVIDFINRVMERLMTQETAEIAYTAEHRLTAGLKKEGGTEILVTEATGEAPPVAEEAACVARRIGELHDGGVCYGDIAVLVRTRTHLGEILEAFSGAGIPTECIDGQIVAMEEVEVFMNLLRLIDGSGDDVMLLSVMRSHLGRMGERDLAQIRAAHQDGTVKEAFLAAAKTGNDKCARLLALLTQARAMERAMRLTEFLPALARLSAYEAHMEALPDGARRANTWRVFFAGLLELAALEESLYTLLMTMDAVKDREGAYARITEESAGLDCVHLTTIHKSKGLEYPVVILMDTAARKGGRDRGKVTIDRDMGLATDIDDVENRKREKTLVRELFKMRAAKSEYAEEVRVLYVAMTRAKDRLILSAAVADPEKYMERFCAPPMRRNSLFDMVMGALCREGAEIGSDGTIRIEGVDARVVQAPSAGRREEKPSRRPAHEVLERGLENPYVPFCSAHGSSTAAKVGVSSLLSEYIAEETAAEAMGTLKGMGAETGTALHAFMAHFSMKKSSEEDVRKEAEEMTARGLITPEERRKAMRFAREISVFSAGDMAYRIRAAEKLEREVPFCLMASPKELGLDGGSEEQVMVQGIIDLLVKEEDGYLILDYKTNAADERNMAALFSHYEKQLAIYERAVTTIRRAPVKSAQLYFVRADRYMSLGTDG